MAEKFTSSTQLPSPSKVLDVVQRLYVRDLYEAKGVPARKLLDRLWGERASEVADTFELGYASWDNVIAKEVKKELDLLEYHLVEHYKLCRTKGKDIYDFMRNKLMYPIHNAEGKLVGWTGQAIRWTGKDKDGPKYMNSEASNFFQKSRLLYNLHRARASMKRTNTVFVVEGTKDVIACWESGFRNVVAPLGTAFTRAHGFLLKNFVKNIILVFDGDDAGRKAIDETYKELQGLGLNIGVVMMEDGLDPYDHYIKYGNLDILKDKILRYHEQLLRVAYRKIDKENSFSYNHAVMFDEIFPLLPRVRDSFFEHIVYMLAIRLNVSIDSIILDLDDKYKGQLDRLIKIQNINGGNK